jgi:hypothetical protein
MTEGGHSVLSRRNLEAQRHRLLLRLSQTFCRLAATSPSREPIMLKATEGEIEEVREYFEWQAPDLEVTFL